MSSRLGPLPPGLSPVFTRAEAAALGVSSRRLLAADVERLAYGIYRRRHARGPEPARHAGEQWSRDQVDRALALGTHLPDGAFYAGLTAAALWGLPLPLPMTRDARLEVMRWNTQGALRQGGLRCGRVTPHRLSVTELRGVPVTDPASMWLSLASRLELRDLVALGDAAIHEARIPGTQRLDRPPLALLNELQEVLVGGRYVGIAKAREALPLLSTRSASAPESHLRLLIREWGLPEPELDYDVTDQRGRLIGCSEFAWPRYRLAAEYEGGHHLTDPRQWDRDIEKYRAYASAGWEPQRVTARLLYVQQAKLRRDLTEALRRRGWRG